MKETPLTKFVEEKILQCKYQFIANDKFKAALYLEQPIYSTNYHIGDGIYETPKYCHYILYHPVKWKDCLIIECIWQQERGTTDEKYPYIVLNIQQRYPHKTIAIIDGGGYRKQARDWVVKQQGNNIIHVFSMGEFSKWVDKGNI